ncbi:MAG: S-adenosylmethionine:tRNA ribosyltransferase-isomerase, partial [Bacteroidales bacterium]|nr:S-adenosylmethionine:tRNA ribosyltransferase-isomerase [Bacteroidales bacterium]
GYLPGNSLLIYNQTRVIQARIPFQKDTGAQIEIFCLEPESPTKEIQQAFELTSGVTWNCLVGNSKKWKAGGLTKTFTIKNKSCKLYAEGIKKSENHSLVKFSWEPAQYSFSEVLEASGIIPLPPYMNRKAEDSDKNRYQTIYARSEGSVAAPTAGLHFTDAVFQKMKEKNIEIKEVTLHVGAGTFKPVSTENVSDHKMHTERICIPKNTIESILNRLNSPVTVVGTTTMRTLESLYWHGVKLIKSVTGSEINIHQWDPYQTELNTGVSVEESLERVLKYMQRHKLEILSGQTQLMIVPGYHIRIPDILITNFHMPQSTLLLLVSAFMGEGWKDAYNYALANNFRFLSYGDSCLFFKH